MEKYKKPKLLNKLLPVSTYKFSKDIVDMFLQIGFFDGSYINSFHFSQLRYILGARNKFFFYNFSYSLFLFSNAVKFLKHIPKINNVKFVFVGSPEDREGAIEIYFKQIILNCEFFPNERWYPGYISKSSQTKNTVLVVYNIKLNYTACKEAFKSNIPVVGFATPSCDIRGIDYPIFLNFKKAPTCYIKILISIFKIVNESNRIQTKI